MMFNKTKALVCALLISIVNTYGQSPLPQNHSISMHGALGTHTYYDQGHLFQDKIYGVDATYSKDISKNSDAWIRITHTKSYGLTLLMRDFSGLKGIKDTSANAFGQAFGLLANIDIQVLRIGKTAIIFSPQIGLSYTNKDYFNSPKNRFLGSHLNETFKTNVGFEHPLSKWASLQAGVSFVHFSNGGAKIPNGGLNTANIYAGLKLGNPREDDSDRKSSYQTLPKSSFEFMAGLGKRGVYQKEKDKLYKSGLYAGYNYRLNDFLTIKGGVDAVYYFKTFDPQQEPATFQYYATSYDKWRLGLSTGADFNIWRVTATAQIGKYLHYNSFYKNITWYWAFGPSFNITPHIAIQAKSYMHISQADYVNYGLLFRI